MNNKTLILIGLCICLLFTLPMVSAADASADSDIIDNSVIGSDIDSQAIAAIDENGLDDKGIDYSFNSSAEEDSGMDSIGIVDDDNSDMDDNDAEISSGKDRNVLSASPLGADGEGNTFSDLKILIENAIASGQPLTLGRDFVFTSGEDDALINGIVIASPITINGGFHTIDGNGMARIFVINSDNVFLRDITFKGGKTTNGDHGSNGGALFIQGNHATVVNCNFTNNTVLEKGGAIYIAGDDCTLNNTVFRDNIAHDDGGAIAWYGDNGKVNDLTASGNTADGENGNPNGGTMLVTGDNMAMDKLNISNSRLYKDGGDKSLKGGAIFLTGNNCNITNSAFTNCSVESSVENSSGGAIYVLGNNTNIIGCNFTNNSAIEDGGAIFIEGDDCTLNHTIFIGNVAHNDGGAIEWNGDNGRIYDLTASGNYADCGNGGSKGGTLLIAGNNIALDKLNVSNTYVNGLNYAGSSAVQGGAIALSGNDCNITNSKFTNCSVIYYKDDSNASGGALYIWGNNTNIVNCNFTNNTASEDGGAIYIDGKGCTLNNTVFIGNVAHNDGGAIEWNGDNGRVYNLTAIGNYADSEEGYYYGNASEGSSKGGTLVLSGNNMALEKLNITNSRVFATHYNGDKPLQGGAVFLTGNNCNISDSIFHNCSVKYDKEKSNGGAMYIIGNNARLINCNFTKNTATQGAGAIYIEGNAAFMENCNVLNNSAKDAGGIWISGKENIINNTDISNNKASRNGGGVYYQGNNNTVSYCNIDNNSAVLGGNVYMASGMVGSKLLGSNITNGNASSFGGGVEWLSNSRDCLIKDCYFYKDFSYGHGGAIHWNPGTNGQIDNCTFENCSVNGTKNGGAVYAGSTNAVASGTIISNSTFINCTSGTRGVLNWIGNNGLIINNTFINCGNLTGDTRWGGNQAIQIQNGKNTQIIECKFYNCTSNTDGAGIRVQGDDNSVNNLTIANCTFDGCIAANSAGALYINKNKDVKDIIIENNTFTNNHAPNYGALDIADAATISAFVNNNFTNNSATAPDGNGGAARLHANINVVNSTFTANSCNGSGGAVYTSGLVNVLGSTFENNTAKSGGAIATNNSNLLVDQSTFKYNKAESGSAISATTVTMSNTELLENQAEFDKWENQNHLISSDHLTVSGTFVGKDNLLNAIKANSGTFNNVTYCGVNGGGVGEGTTNTDDVLSANSYNEVHQIIVMEVYDVNGELKYNVSTYTDEDGNYNFDLSLDGDVVSLVKVYHPEDNYYTGAEYEIVRVPSELSINCENIYVDQEERITFRVTGSKDTPTGNITVLINDTNGNVIFNGTVPLNSSGETNITLSGLNESQYYIYANYTGDYDYLPDAENAAFNVSKWNSTVEVVPVPSIIYGSLENINITVSSSGTTGNFTGNLTVNITSEDAIGFENITKIIELTLDDEGRIIGWTIDDIILPVGNYTIAVAYSGNYKYNGNSSKSRFAVVKAEPAVNVNTTDIDYNTTEPVKVNVTGVDGGEIPTGNVTVVVFNKSGNAVFNDTVPIENGAVTVPVEALTAGDYNVTVTYNGDANYDDAVAKANFTVRAIDSAITVNVTNITYGDDETVKFNVTEGATGTVNITVTGADGVVATFTDVPIANGTVGVDVAGLPAGNYSVNVTYNGDNNFNPSSAVANFTVSNAKPTVNVNATDIDYNNTEPVKFNVTGVDGGAVPTGNVTVVVVNSSGEVVFNDTVPVEDGVVTVPVLPAGDYDVTVTYNGDGNYSNATGKADFTISAIDSAVTVDPVNITYGDDEIIKFNVTDGATGTVNITVTGADGVVKTFNDVPIANGTVGVNVADLPAGNYTVNVTYNGDNNFNPSSAVANFTVSKATPAVNVNATDIDYNNTEDIVINVTGVEDGIIPTGNVTVIVTNASGDVVFNETADLSDGKKTVTVPVLPAGDYDVTVTYNGDANYNGAEAKADFTVGMIDSNVTMDLTNITYGENETIKYNVTEGATGTVNITVTDSTGAVVYSEIVPVENGTVGVDVAGLAAGNYTVNVTYSGDNNFNPSSNVANFTVDKVEPTVNVNTTDVDYGNAENILVNVTGVDGGAVPTGNVTVVVTDDGDNVVFNKTVPIENGVATVPVDELPAGDYNVTVTYNGDANYTSATSKDEFTVSKAEPDMKIETTDIDYGQDEDIAIDVTGVDGGAVPTGNVTVVVTDDSGAVVFNKTVPVEDGGVTVPSLPSGDYDVTVTYNGDENYTSLTKNDHFSVGKTTPTVLADTEDIDFHDSEKINVTVNDDATGNVTITVTDENGTVVANETVKISEGKASIDVADLPAGKYDVTVEYHGDNNYKRATVEANFTVNAIDPTVVVNASDIDFHDSEKINVTVNDDATGNVTITVTDENGTVVASESVKINDGKASIDVDDLPAGKYNVTVEYPGDNNYKSATSKTNFTVNKIDTPVNMETENITYGEEETITVSVNDDATGDVTISIVSKDGTTVYSENVPIDKASATVTVPNLNAGNYTVQVDYSGDNNYKPNSAEGKFEVAKANATVEIHVYDIIYGDIEELTVSCDAPGNVTIYVNGVNITLPLEEGHGHTLFAALLNAYSGKAQWDLENLAVGTYPASVHYNGNENYNEADDDDVFHVIKKETSVSVSADDIKVGEDAVINVELSPEAAPGDLTITVDGKEYTVTPKDGKATLKVPGLKAGKHNVTVSYPGSQNYTNSSNSTTFTVSKNSPKMSVSSHDIKVDEDEKITVSVPKDATGTVTITVNGKEYTAPVKDGKAVFNVPGLKAGDYTVKAKYNGDDKYLPEESSDKFTVSKVKPDIKTSAPTVKVGEDGKVTVTLPKDATGKVTIEIDGKKYTAKVKDGKAVFTVSGLKVGKHHINVYYSGDDKYESAAVDGGDLEVIADNGNGQSEGQAHNGKAIDLSSKATGNPVLALLLVFVILGLIPLRRNKDDEEDEEENP